MPALHQRTFRVSAIASGSFTLTPVIGVGTGGTPIDGPVGGSFKDDISSGITSIVINNNAGTPDSTFTRLVNSLVKVSIETA
jgi:hypothetical protein